MKSLKVWLLSGLSVLALAIAIEQFVLGGFISHSHSRMDNVRQTMKEISAALLKYKDRCGSFPTEEEGLERLLELPAICGESAGDYFLKQGHLKDPWRNRYFYVIEEGVPYLISRRRDVSGGGLWEEAIVWRVGRE